MQKSYALFDFDGTLIKGDSIIRFCLYAHRRGLLDAGELARAALMGLAYCCRLITAERSKQAALRFLAGRGEAEMAALARDFCRDELLPSLYPEGVAEVKRCQEQGAEALLITASPSFYLQPLKEKLGFAEIIGTRMDVGPDGRLTGLICGDNCRGLQKPLRLAEYLAARGDRLSYADSRAYGDSGSDQPMLMLCAGKIAVNPKKKLLRLLSGADGVQAVRWGVGAASRRNAHARRA